MSKTTIQLDKTTKDRIDDLVDGKNYNQKVLKLIDGYKQESQEPIEDYSVTVEAEDMRPVIREELADAMSDVTIDVTVDGESGMNEDDVRNVIENELDGFRRELRQ